jgi:hypothetical protein
MRSALYRNVIWFLCFGSDSVSSTTLIRHSSIFCSNFSFHKLTSCLIRSSVQYKRVYVPFSEKIRFPHRTGTWYLVHCVLMKWARCNLWKNQNATGYRVQGTVYRAHLYRVITTCIGIAPCDYLKRILDTPFILLKWGGTDKVALPLCKLSEVALMRWQSIKLDMTPILLLLHFCSLLLVVVFAPTLTNDASTCIRNTAKDWLHLDRVAYILEKHRNETYIP